MSDKHAKAKEQTSAVIQVIAILSVFLFSGAGTYMNAAVQTMIEAWPTVAPSTVRMVTALPSLISMPVTILIGSIAGRKVSYRFLAIAGTALILLAGIAPFFLSSNWILVLFFRALVGVGVGFIAMRNSLILKSVPENRQAAVIGYGSSLMNAGGMLASPIVGMLAQRGWQYSFLFDLLAVIPLIIIILFLKEPDKEEIISSADASRKSSVREKINWRVPFYIVIQFISTAALFPLLSGISSYLTAEGAGDAVSAGFAIAAYNLAGLVINIVLSPIVRKLGKNTLWIMNGLFACAMALIVFIPHLPVILIGAALAGVAFNTNMSVFQLYNGKAAGTYATLTSTILIAALNLGNFMSVYFIELCHKLFDMSSDIRSAYFGSMLLYLLMTLICGVLRVAPQE